MKYILYLVLLISTTLFPQETRHISIQKNNQGGFDIIRNGELIYEYTNKNTDSSTLSTLNNIYFEATKDSSLSTGIMIINAPPEASTDYTGAIIAVAVVFFSYMTARYLYNRQVRAENKRAWLERVRTVSAEFIPMMALLKKAEKDTPVPPEFTTKLYTLRFLFSYNKYRKLREVLDLCTSVSEKENLLNNVRMLITLIEEIISTEQEKLDKGKF